MLRLLRRMFRFGFRTTPRWHLAEFQRLRAAIFIGAVVALVFLLPGAFLGAAGWNVKFWWLWSGMMVMIILIIYFALKRIVIGAGIAAAIKEVIK